MHYIAFIFLLSIMNELFCMLTEFSQDMANWFDCADRTKLSNPAKFSGNDLPDVSQDIVALPYIEARLVKMRFKSSMASLLPAIGRKSPWVITRCICSWGEAFSQTVKHSDSSNLKVAGSDTMPPGVAITASG